MKLSNRYINEIGSVLRISAKNGKRGVHVSAMLRVSGQPTQTGCRSTVATEAEAKTAFDALCHDAVKNGWVLSAQKERSSFTAIPQANPTHVKREAEKLKKSA
jgi:hypothetical protein